MGHDDRMGAELLALRAAAGSRQHALACALQAEGLDRVSRTGLFAPTDAHRALAARQMTALTRLDLTLVPIWLLPQPLREVTPLPVALFVRGDARLLYQRPAVALVGARRAGAAGVAWAQAQAEALSVAGTLVVSGGALGIDTAAHEGALCTGKPTLAYMGTAIDCIYPRSNADLFARMLMAGGALVSEHPPYARTFKGHHALRNRLIAAHAQALLVVEAAPASGTLSAVGFARRLHRPVFVAPALVGGERGAIDDLLRRGWAHTWPGPAQADSL